MVCTIAVVVLDDARTLLLSPSNTHPIPPSAAAAAASKTGAAAAAKGTLKLKYTAGTASCRFVMPSPETYGLTRLQNMKQQPRLSEEDGPGE